MADQDQDAPKVLSTERGGVKLYYAGYLYVKKRTRVDLSVKWQCDQQKSKKCAGAITTDAKPYTNPREYQDHNHDPDPTRRGVISARNDMKRAAENPNAGRTIQILANGLLDSTVDVRQTIGQPSAIKRDIQRHRRASYPPEPATRREIEIPEAWSTTGDRDNQRFLLADDGEGDARILIFATDGQLAQLARRETWYGDGNFHAAPSVFYQVYVLRVGFEDKTISCIYALLPNKTQETYTRLFRIILQELNARGHQPNPQTMMTDFEIAARNGFRTIFAGARLQGCFYHLTQSTYRKVIELGLKRTYEEDENVRHFLGSLDGLAFLPPNRVADGLAHLTTITPPGLQGVVEYFDSTYVNGRLQRNGQRIPDFAPQQWNVHIQTLQNTDRTNNNTEGWNNLFNHLIGDSHPSIWKLIQGLRRDWALVSTTVMQLEAGLPVQKRQRAKFVQHQENLRRLVLRYVRDQDIPALLGALGRSIRLKRVPGQMQPQEQV